MTEKRLEAWAFKINYKRGMCQNDCKISGMGDSREELGTTEKKRGGGADLGVV